ncbi:MAG: hypothetical protein U1A24_20295 [Cypionkella sp.]|uniref:hypothetical protein n=1 Tax=Cypionkella sp. TaxID=2811411 RepID=UPI002ABC2F94|nr:hypothetical protein [Cypionkella sp.]MDZ4312894.1 hypothetical protein [Cypionkella sp.]MDZ4392827.1 hypothetical protein [Cypionkella sp.]
MVEFNDMGHLRLGKEADWVRKLHGKNIADTVSANNYVPQRFGHILIATQGMEQTGRQPQSTANIPCFRATITKNPPHSPGFIWLAPDTSKRGGANQRVVQ